MLLCKRIHVKKSDCLDKIFAMIKFLELEQAGTKCREVRLFWKQNEVHTHNIQHRDAIAKVEDFTAITTSLAIGLQEPKILQFEIQLLLDTEWNLAAAVNCEEEDDAEKELVIDGNN